MASYKKLSRQRRNASGYSRLWLADDHVLLVTTSGYSEDYRRFFFSDIQALTIRKTRAGAGWNWAFGSTPLLFATLGVIYSEGLLLCLILASIFAASAGINAVLGPTCSVQIQTAIAVHPLEPLHRLRAARKVIARIKPLITAAQGEVTPEQLAMITAQSPQMPVATPIS